MSATEIIWLCLLGVIVIASCVIAYVEDDGFLLFFLPIGVGGVLTLTLGICNVDNVDYHLNNTKELRVHSSLITGDKISIIFDDGQTLESNEIKLLNACDSGSVFYYYTYTIDRKFGFNSEISSITINDWDTFKKEFNASN